MYREVSRDQRDPTFLRDCNDSGPLKFTEKSQWVTQPQFRPDLELRSNESVYRSKSRRHSTRETIRGSYVYTSLVGALWTSTASVYNCRVVWFEMEPRYMFQGLPLLLLMVNSS